LYFSRIKARLWQAVSLTLLTWSWQNLKNIGKNSVYTTSLSNNAANYPRFYAIECLILQSYYASLYVCTMNLMNFTLFSGYTSYKNMWRFLKAPTLISFTCSFKNFSIIGTKSYSVISLPNILANSWIEWERVFLILISLNLASFK
jgi:hypothetical protein